MTQALPTRREEAYRYADLAALAPMWPVATEALALSEGEERALTIISTGSDPLVREVAVHLASSAKLDLRVLNAGTAYGRIALRVELGKGAEFMLGAAQLAGGGQVLELVTEVVHAAPDATSRQIVRSVAGGQATTNYLGKVLVAKGADGTDGEQSVRAMLLDRRASANARPELEIHADDVKCAHGCAVGELDANAMFYLQSRGLPPSEARKLMLQAFIAEAFAGAADEEHLLELALERLGELV